uniref:Uncharacterized protein n=1 Tax=Pararge aegeria TaxID=116150 RepID=S4PDJ5_9NEOP
MGPVPPFKKGLVCQQCVNSMLLATFNHQKIERNLYSEFGSKLQTTFESSREPTNKAKAPLARCVALRSCNAL